MSGGVLQNREPGPPGYGLVKGTLSWLRGMAEHVGRGGGGGGGGGGEGKGVLQK